MNHHPGGTTEEKTDRGKQENYRTRREQQWEAERYPYENVQGWNTPSDSDSIQEIATSKNRINTMNVQDTGNDFRYHGRSRQRDRPKGVRFEDRTEHHYNDEVRRGVDIPRHEYEADHGRHRQQQRERHREQARVSRGKDEQVIYSTSSEGESPNREKTKKSGINAKPTSNVKEQLTYLHCSLGQISGFIGQNLPFHQLTFEQFMAGELTTILSAESEAEREGRTELLQRIAMWKLRTNVSWAQVRNAYAHIIRKI